MGRLRPRRRARASEHVLRRHALVSNKARPVPMSVSTLELLNCNGLRNAVRTITARLTLTRSLARKRVGAIPPGLSPPQLDPRSRRDVYRAGRKSSVPVHESNASSSGRSIASLFLPSDFLATCLQLRRRPCPPEEARTKGQSSESCAKQPSEKDSTLALRCFCTQSYLPNLA